MVERCDSDKKMRKTEQVKKNKWGTKSIENVKGFRVNTTQGNISCEIHNSII